LYPSQGCWRGVIVAVVTATRATVRIALADDHAVVRSGLRMLLESEPDLAVVGEAGAL